MPPREGEIQDVRAGISGRAEDEEIQRHTRETGRAAQM